MQIFAKILSNCLYPIALSLHDVFIDVSVDASDPINAVDSSLSYSTMQIFMKTLIGKTITLEPPTPLTTSRAIQDKKGLTSSV